MTRRVTFWNRAEYCRFEMVAVFICGLLMGLATWLPVLLP